MVTRDEVGPLSVLVAHQDATPAAPDARPPVEAARAPVDALIRIVQVADGEFFAGDLFRRRFGSDPPDCPAHFVALHRAAANCYVAVGYVHYRIFDNLCLCGGLTEDERAVRRMPAPHQAAVRAAGGVQAALLRGSLALLPEVPAVWACVGDAPVRAELQRAGFVPVDDPYLMVRWRHDLEPAAEQALLARVRALGRF